MLQAVAEMKLLFHGLLHCLVFLNKTLQSGELLEQPDRMLRSDHPAQGEKQYSWSFMLQ